jgi:hypothetical protein
LGYSRFPRLHGHRLSCSFFFLADRTVKSSDRPISTENISQLCKNKKKINTDIREGGVRKNANELCTLTGKKNKFPLRPFWNLNSNDNIAASSNEKQENFYLGMRD